MSSNYWWDLEGEPFNVVVESLGKYPILAVLDDQTAPVWKRIETAECIIKELDSGRLTEKDCYSKYVKCSEDF